MQHNPSEKERYADGLAEYGNYYGQSTCNYLAPTKLATSTTYELPAEDVHSNGIPPVPPRSNARPFALASYAPSYKDHAKGLQVAASPSRPESTPTYEHGLIVDSQQEIPYMFNAKFSQTPIVPSYTHQTPMNHSHENNSSTAPSNVPGNYQSLLLHTNQPLHPQPLRLRRPLSTLPPTPPMSYGSSVSNDDGFSERMQALHLSSQQPETLRYLAGPLKLMNEGPGRMGTMRSMSSGGTSTYASSPMQESLSSPFSAERRSVAVSIISGQDSDTPNISAGDARAEVLRRLSHRKGSTSSSAKKGFSLRRTNTGSTSSTGYSQDALTDVLEDAAHEGNLPLVEAVIELGADPVYRSNGRLKKSKHDALVKATSEGRARVVDFLLTKGASYGEAQKKSTFTPLDRALLGAAYQGHADLVNCLISLHDANPMVVQWPREMDDTQHYWAESQVRLAKTSALDGISKWKNVEQGMNTLKAIFTHPQFDPAALVFGVFDTKSELQTAEFGHRPWQTTYEYSVLSSFVRAGWADAVEEILYFKSTVADYEKEDEVLQYQDKVTRYVSPISALTKEIWKRRPEEALRILRLLIEKNFDIGLAQRTASDLGKRTVLGRAVSADAAQGIEMILQSKPNLVREEIFFRRLGKETKALPLAAALSLNRLEAARVLLRAGAHPRDPAFDNMNVLQFAAYQGDETGTALLAEMIGLAPELTYSALKIAIRRVNKDVIRILLGCISTAAMREQVASLPPVYDMLLQCEDSSKDSDTQAQYLEIVDMVVQWDAGYALQRPQLAAILSAIRKDNYIGMEKLLQLGIVEGQSLVLNSKAQPQGEQGLWTVLACCELTNRSSEWLRLLRYYGAPLYH